MPVEGTVVPRRNWLIGALFTAKLLASLAVISDAGFSLTAAQFLSCPDDFLNFQGRATIPATCYQYLSIGSIQATTPRQRRLESSQIRRGSGVQKVARRETSGSQSLNVSRAEGAQSPN
jgi:hypothetical protein